MKSIQKGKKIFIDELPVLFENVEKKFYKKRNMHSGVLCCSVDFSSANVFLALALYNNLRLTLMKIFPEAVRHVSEAAVALR